MEVWFADTEFQNRYARNSAMHDLRTLVILLMVFVVNLNPCVGKPPREANNEDLANLQKTAKRYFASISGYQEGDLISRSQIEEFQDYLRKTRGHSPATHRRLLSRVLADDSRLIRLFYSQDSAELLREAVSKGYKYSTFFSLSRNTSDFAKLTDAVKLGSSEQIIQLAIDKSQQLEADSHKAGSQAKRKQKPAKIFTVNDYLAAIAIAYESSATKVSQP